MVMKLQLYKFIAMGIVVISSQFPELRSSRGLCMLAITVPNFYLLPNNSFLFYKAHQIAFKRFSYFLFVLFVLIFLFGFVFAVAFILSLSLSHPYHERELARQLISENSRSETSASWIAQMFLPVQ